MILYDEDAMKLGVLEQPHQTTAAPNNYSSKKFF